jgi:NhaA family Na+:H+ antiporter
VKVFLTSLAVFDDVGAIIIIALFYTSKVSLTALIVALICLPILYRMNRKGIADISPYLLVGLVVWVAMLKSGVHATLAGVVIAMFIPNTTKRHNGTYSPLKSLEHDLHPLVSFIILPVFAFANAGLELRGLTATQMLDSVPMGIALGLFVGKQLGIFSFCWLFVKLKLVTLPKDMNALTLYGVSIICGIGFTMSLFISALAFEDLGVSVAFNERLGIIIGSLVSGIVGYLVLKYSLSRQAKQ